jgi:hypothetical protein
MMIRCALLVAASSAEQSIFPDSAVFERLQHFKDVGVPNTLEDPFNRAAIADGTCRVTTGKAAYSKDAEGGYASWHSNAGRVKAVLDALAALPSSDGPSQMTLAAKATLPAVCGADAPAADGNDLSFYNATVAAGSMQAWFRALCDKDEADPAYQPQQQALTVGFACAIACDAAGKKLSASSVDALAATPVAIESSVHTLCIAIPYAKDQFAGLDSFAQIADASSKWREQRPCRC